MKKHVFGRQFKRDSNERKALFKNLLTSLVLHERIRTSTAKAKAIKGAADKLVTKAKKGGQQAVRLIEADLNHDAVVKLIAEIAPRFANRNGGYTRIIHIGNRLKDNSSEVLLEWTEKAKTEIVSEKTTEKPAKKEKSNTVKSKKQEIKEPVKKKPVVKASTKKVQESRKEKVVKEEKTK
jgi:large subunit ribosomal protein L17